MRTIHITRSREVKYWCTDNDVSCKDSYHPRIGCVFDITLPEKLVEEFREFLGMPPKKTPKIGQKKRSTSKRTTTPPRRLGRGD